MAGRIKADVVAAVKERTSIEDVVREHVTLRSGGIGSLKGLCPFHDEKSPVLPRPPAARRVALLRLRRGRRRLSFVQRVDHLTFAEAVERLADKAGITVEYDEGGARPREQVGRRRRLLEANRAAEEFYAEQLRRPRGRAGRRFLADRGFDREAAARSASASPRGPVRRSCEHLRGQGFTDDELTVAGLAGRG